MVDFRTLRDRFLLVTSDTEFDVSTDDFEKLVIQEAQGFHYFFHTEERRLIKSFLLREGPQVDDMCDVVLAGREDRFTPRMRFWKKDKTAGKRGQAALDSLEAGETTVLVKASVDLGDACVNLWKLIDFLRSFKGVTLPSHEFRVTEGADAELLDALRDHDKATVLGAVKTYLGSKLTESDVRMLVDRRETLEWFERLLNEDGLVDAERERMGLRGVEAVWQQFFESNPWIFGYGLTLVSCDKVSDKALEAVTTGENVFTGGGKRIDALMRTRGIIESLVFVEIKKHDTPLLATKPYREPDVYRVSTELSGAVAQVQKTTHKAIKRLQDLHRQHTPRGEYEFDVSTIAPRMVVVVGNMNELAPGDEVNVEKMSSFELFRRNQQGVEVLTFDELLERTRFIVESGEAATAGA